MDPGPAALTSPDGFSEKQDLKTPPGSTESEPAFPQGPWVTWVFLSDCRGPASTRGETAACRRDQDSFPGQVHLGK